MVVRREERGEGILYHNEFSSVVAPQFFFLRLRYSFIQSTFLICKYLNSPGDIGRLQS